ncbi:MAG: replication-associated recombination protein A [Spirochaetales bacterium]
MDLFSDNVKKMAPLPERMRPKNLEGFIGQQHLIYNNSLLVKAINAGSLGSVIFYGPPGTGKTTLAGIIANMTSANFKKLNAVSSGVADAKETIKEAKSQLALYGKKTYLLLDECHRWSKAQSDSILEAIEDGSIILIGSTTENPYISMTSAILSRVKVFEFKRLTKEDIKVAIKRALTDKENGLGELDIVMDDKVIDFLASQAVGDMRVALNTLELASSTSGINKDKKIEITISSIEECLQNKSLSVDEDLYYHLLSAFCKSLRGSDPDAALYYANRMILGGVDPRIIARRLVAHASEDVGMADSNAMLLANAALDAVEKLGMPEGNIPLTHAIIYVCLAPKSNSVVVALGRAQQDALKYVDDNVPPYLKNNTPQSKNYKYPHDFGGYVKQQYLPDSLKDAVYYEPSKNGREKDIKIIKREK